MSALESERGTADTLGTGGKHPADAVRAPPPAQAAGARRTTPEPARAPSARGAGPVDPWLADPWADALRSGQGPVFLRRDDGWLLPLEVERWCAAADPADATVLDRCEGAVLDVGCGPGRLVHALAAAGRPVLGIDVCQEAVDRTVTGGGTALRRSVFDPLPGEGRWGTVLLMDGNVGIGGDPGQLLERAAELVEPEGQLLVEAAAPDVDERVAVQVVDGRGTRGAGFRWARVGALALPAYADATGWRVERRWRAGDRNFLQLRRRRR
ncbi:class I SAM-dependent methyltransferase [Streptomyces sp. NPDC056524]|uniref:class I SAM-dependent methyltransferase n=1 Tax=Streptomyces sp. NPDC056524 TaxID=3345851 RepID=UPI0036CE4458